MSLAQPDMSVLAANASVEVLAVASVIFLSTSVVGIGALRSVALWKALAATRDQKSKAAAAELLSNATITTRTAILFPVLASAVLLTLFLFKAIQNLLVIYMVFSSAVCVAFMLSPLFIGVQSQGTSPALLASNGSTLALLRRFAIPVAIGSIISLVWAWTNSSMVLGNIIGISLCLSMISVIRLPSLKVGALILALLFVYDIYWVFISPLVHGANVMVAVATQAAENPAKTAVSVVESVLPVKVPADMAPALTLDPPNKLVFPVPQLHYYMRGDSSQPLTVWFVHLMMLGLGDIALPGIVVAFALHVDKHLLSLATQQHAASKGSSEATASPSATVVGSSNTCASFFSWLVDKAFPIRRLYREVFVFSRAAGAPSSLFRACMIGYCCGLAITFLFGRLFEAAQPALLYLVPCTLIPFVVQARSLRSTPGSEASGQSVSGVDVWKLVWEGLPKPEAAAEADSSGGTRAASEGGNSQLEPRVAVVVPNALDDDDAGDGDLALVQRRAVGPARAIV